MQAVNLLLKKNKMMQAEIANHEPRVNAVFENGQKLISEGHPKKDKYERDLNDLTEKLVRLQDLLEARRQSCWLMKECNSSCLMLMRQSHG